MTSFNPIKRSPLKPNFLCFLKQALPLSPLAAPILIFPALLNSRCKFCIRSKILHAFLL